jgi:hypothetical protein
MPLNEVWKITSSSASCVEAFETPEEARRYLLRNGAVFSGYDSGVYIFKSAVEEGVEYAIQDINAITKVKLE